MATPNLLLVVISFVLGALILGYECLDKRRLSGRTMQRAVAPRAQVPSHPAPHQEFAGGEMPQGT